ncbi:MAG: cupin protein [Polaromonas sp.]|nr:cupin protein [Polaromonas sp.]
MNQLPPVRRVVTAINERGLSHVSEDGPSAATLTHPDRPGYRNAHLWRTTGMPAAIHAPDDIGQHKGVMPPALGTVFRVVDMPPQPAGATADMAAQVKQQAGLFASLYGDVKTQAGNTRHAGMHITDSIDYAIVLSGEIYAVMDEGETLLKAGDVLIQRGTNHAWDNRSSEVARLAFVLVDGRGTRA